MEQEIENVLRAAPRPTPPAGLKERLIAQVRLTAVRPSSQTPANSLAPAGMLRRWWPALVPASVSLACAAALTMQQIEIRDLKQAIQDLSRDSAAKAGALSTPTVQTNDAASEAEAAARTQQEIARLKELASQLAVEVAQLEQMGAENAKLRTQLAAPPAGLLTPEETEELAKAKEKAESIACINNLKQLGLSVRVWALDNGDTSPPNILDMTNEMSTPKILACPADHGRQKTDSFASYTPANCSYEYLAPSAPDTDPNRVLFRCPIHGHVCLSDGSVQAEVAKRHPDWLVQRDGKLYLQAPAQPPEAAPVPANPPPADPNP
jgi:hypothetical protein